MGTGNYRSADGKTVILELYDDIDQDEDTGLAEILAGEAFSDFEGVLGELLEPTSFWMVKRSWRRSGRDERILAENGHYQIWVHEDSYGHTFVTYGVSENIPDGMDGLARARLDERAERFFDRLQEFYDLRVATCAWTSAPRAPAKAAA